MADLNKVRVQVLDPTTGKVVENVDVKTSDAAVYLPDGTNLRSWINDSEEIHAELQEMVSEHINKKHVDPAKIDSLLTGISYNQGTGTFTITNHSGKTQTIDTLLEKLAINFDLVDGDGITGYKAGDKLLKVTLDDGAIKYANLTSLVDVYTGKANTQVNVSVSNGEISATLVDGGVSTAKLANGAVTTGKIADGTVTRAKIDTAFEQQIAALEGAVGTGGSVDSKITDAIGKLDATKSQAAGADGLALSITQTDGLITAISGSIKANTYDKYGAAAAVQGSTTETVKSVDDKVTALKTASAVTVEKLASAESGYIASYVVKQNGAKVGSTINIPKDYLVKSAALKTASADIKVGDSVVVASGHKYIDFVVNTKDDTSGEGTHIYLDVNTLVDVYGVTANAKEVQLALDTTTNKFSATIVNGAVTYDKLDAALKKKVDYTYSLPDATTTAKGGVIVGNGLAVSAGKISTTNVKLGGTATAINFEKGSTGLITVEGPAAATVYTTKGTAVSGQTIKATGSGSAASATFTYQWYKKLVGTDAAFTAISGATAATLDASKIAVAAAGTTMYYCVVSATGVDPVASKKITVVVA